MKQPGKLREKKTFIKTNEIVCKHHIDQTATYQKKKNTQEKRNNENMKRKLKAVLRFFMGVKYHTGPNFMLIRLWHYKTSSNTFHINR